MYRIEIRRSAQKRLASIAPPDRSRIIEAITELGVQPRPSGARKLTDRQAWRIRVGDYRVIYEIHDQRLEILIISLGHRRDVYR